jgi:hypothetical protein
MGTLQRMSDYEERLLRGSKPEKSRIRLQGERRDRFSGTISWACSHGKHSQCSKKSCPCQLCKNIGRHP